RPAPGYVCVGSSRNFRHPARSRAGSVALWPRTRLASPARADPVCRRRLPEHVLVVLGRQAVHLDDPAPELRPFPPGPALALELDTRTVRQRLQRTPKVGFVGELDEGEKIAAFLAAEAVPGLHLLVQREAGRLFLVKGTKADEL